MTVTDNSTELEQVSDADTGVSTSTATLPPPPPSGVAGVIAASDHKTIGRLYLGFAVLFGVVAAVAGALVSAEGIDAGGLQILTDGTYHQVFTLSLVSGFFLFALPVMIGLGTYVVPLQMGAPAIAFPRASAASFWGWLVGAGITLAAYGIDGGIAGDDTDPTMLAVVGLGLVIISLGLGAICIATTVATIRPSGMSLSMVPAFSWSMLVATAIWTITLPITLGHLILMHVDLDNAQLLYSDDAIAWEMFRFIFRQPAVFMFAIPVLGIVADVIPTLSGRRQNGHAVVLGIIGAFGALTFGAWAQPVFNPELVRQALYILMSLAIVLPVLAFFGGAADTLRQGRALMKSPLLLGLVALFLLLDATLAAAAHSIDAFNLQGTMFGLGISKLVLGVVAIGAAAGLNYWGRLIWGRGAIDPLGMLNVLVLAGGTALFAGADLLAGILGQREADLDGFSAKVEDNAELASLVGAIGGALLALGLVLTLLSILPGVLRRRTVDEYDNTQLWDGLTLEWAAPAPPPHGNFVGPLPPVLSPYPLLDAREAKEVTV